MRINLNDIFNMPTAVIYEPDKFRSASGVVIDSRQKVKNSIFVAIKGKNFDGHDFVKQAVQKGAAAVVINNRKLSRYDDLNAAIITVKNTVKAYGYLAKVWRRKSNAKVISLTGSNGKTTTKEMLSTLLETKYKVVKTERNNNNQIGVPLTILNVKPETEVLILEHGTNHPGEIAYTAEIAEPDFALITNIGASHLQFFNNIEGVLEEKFSLFKTTLEHNGKIFVNSDDAFLRKAISRINDKITFGFKGKPDVKGRIISYDEFGHPKIEIHYKNKVMKIKLPLLGKANASNFLAAVAVALRMGVGKGNLIKATRSLKSVRGRLNLNVLNDFVLIDDTYNSNPVSVAEAVAVMKKIKACSTKVLILGDMLELGAESKSLHSELAKEISTLKKFEVLTIGKNMKALADALGSKAKHFTSRKSLNKHLSKMELKGKCFLVKGSRGMMMEEFVDSIKIRNEE